MPEKKKQHYVPKCLLKNFSDSKQNIHIFRLEKNNIISKPVPYGSQCKNDYMYGKDVFWENKLNDYETIVSPIIDKIIHCKFISVEEESIIKNFVLFQHLRTDKAVDINLGMINHVTRKTLDIISQMKSLNLSSEQLDEYASHYIQMNHSRANTAMQNLEIATKYINSIDDLHLVFLQTETSEFVCSDNPVVMENLFQSESGLGFGCAGIILFMPISSKFAILLYDSKIYLTDKDPKLNIIMLTNKETFQFNKFAYLYAKELLFANNVNELKKLKEYFDRKYIDNNLRKILSFFGRSDPILIGIEIEKLKKSNLKVINETIPKFIAKKEYEVFPVLYLNEYFKPYANKRFTFFLRNETMDELRIRMSYWDKNFCALVEKYFSKK